MAASETSVCNMALGRIGSTRINAMTDTTEPAIHCRLHYDQARDALLQSHWWKFALARAVLSEDTVAPAFQWAHQFILPSDCLRVIGLYEPGPSYSLEGQRLLTDEATIQIRYVRKITDVGAFSPLFIEALALSLALRLVMPLSQDKALRDQVEGEYRRTVQTARLVNLQELSTVGSDDVETWVGSRTKGTV